MCGPGRAFPLSPGLPALLTLRSPRRDDLLSSGFWAASAGACRGVPGGDHGPPPRPDASVRARRSRTGPAGRWRGTARPLRVLRAGPVQRLPRRPAPAGVPAAAAGGAAGERGGTGAEPGGPAASLPAHGRPSVPAGAPGALRLVRPRVHRPGGGCTGAPGAAAAPGE